MTQIRQRTVVFADLRGSTALFENLGNAEATSVVTHTIGLMRQAIADLGGRTVKTLGDGLMAVFDLPSDALTAAVAMHETLERLVAQGASAAPRRACAPCVCRSPCPLARWWKWAATALATPSMWPPA